MLQKWKSANKRLMLLSNMSLQNRVAQHKVETLTEERAMSAKTRLDTYRLSDIKDASSGAAAFYLWVGHCT